MTMPGKGPHKINAGQVTDDTEMALCLAYGILDSNFNNDEKIINLDLIAFRYRDWIRSEPFDIGITTKNALQILNCKTRKLTEDLNLIYEESRAKQCKNTAKRMNANSKSNGCMMRLTPLIIFVAGLIKDEQPKDSLENELENFKIFKNAIKGDVEFTHSEKVSQHSCILYSVAISYLLNNPTKKDRG